MYKNLILTGLVLLSPSSALAAGSVPSGAIAQILTAIDGAFASAQTAVRTSSLNEEQKSSVSNVLKTKHDTVKNSVGNIR